MKESELNATQVAILLGAVCIAAAVAAGLLFKKLTKKDDALWAQTSHVPNSVFPGQ